MKRRPKTGEQRAVRQPFSIDRLPLSVRDEIKSLRAEFRSWEDIEELSREFVPWDKLPDEVVKLFPGQKLPHSNLQRWYDVQVEQAWKREQERNAQAREIAQAFAGQPVEKLPEAVMNALSQQVFKLARLAGEGGDNRKFTKELGELAWIIAEMRKSDVREKQVAIETRRVDLLEKKLNRALEEAKGKLEKGKELTIADINRIRERTFGLPPVQR